MNTTVNIPVLPGLGAINALKPQGLGQAAAPGQQGLLGFLGLILQNIGGAQNLSAQTEKIAAFLKNNPGDIAGLQNLLQTIAPDAPKDLLQKVSQLLGNITQEGIIDQAAKPALISDLAASLATDLQQAPTIETQIAVLLDEKPADIASQLNTLTPGSADETAPLDINILNALVEKVETFKDTGGNLAALKSEIITFLQQQGVSDDALTQYTAALAQQLRGTAGLPLPPGLQHAAQNSAADLRAPTILPPGLLKSGGHAFGEPDTGGTGGPLSFNTEETDILTLQPRGLDIAAKKAPPALIQSVQAAILPQAQSQPQSAKTALPLALSTINNLISSENSDGFGGFGGSVPRPFRYSTDAAANHPGGFGKSDQNRGLRLNEGPLQP